MQAGALCNMFILLFKILVMVKKMYKDAGVSVELVGITRFCFLEKIILSEVIFLLFINWLCRGDVLL